MYTETNPSPQENGQASERPSVDVRGSTAELKIVELQRQRAEVLTQMAALDANDPSQAEASDALFRKLENIKVELQNAQASRDAVDNEQDLRRLGEQAVRDRGASTSN